jgi:uncharacterized tellurite resistance protein B-like protein
MSYFSEDIKRSLALVELLCLAGAADSEFDAEERAIVRAQLAVLLGPLADDVAGHLKTFQVRGASLEAVLTRMQPSRDADRRAVMLAVREVLRADGAVSEIETTFLTRVGQLLRFPPERIDGF